MSRKRLFILLALGALFLFRLWYGVHSEFWFEDERQIYLIGLKYYTTGAYPVYGPDVVYTKTQIAGGMQGLLVGAPFHLLPIPEAPYILLNAMSFAALCVFAWYCSRRFPKLPVWFVWMFVLGAAWTMNFGTRVVNPSYVLPFSLLFFISAFDMLPVFTTQLLPRRLPFFLMGLGITAIMQLHLSWVLLVPYCIAALVWKSYRSPSFKQAFSVNILPLAAGLAAGAITLIPTWLNAAYSPTGGAEKNIVFNP
ncbi:MAG: hypothetical protein JNL32_09455, partial [Candidatus Kapabacteria bacterium]|nr:hypothetical protein [Candidatus Kapabacteria bacterium]